MSNTPPESERFDNSFDIQLQSLTHYQRFPQMMPLIGSHYRRMNKRILVIGESHYLERDSSIHLDAHKWYHNTTINDLTETERGWSHTRDTSGSGMNQKYHAKSFTIYRNVEKALRDVLSGEDISTDSYFRYAAFYNYFQRPAQTGISVANVDLDDEYAYQHLQQLQQVIQADQFAFVSKRAYHSFLHRYQAADFPDVDTFATAHPACSWWNRVHKHYHYDQVEQMTSREWFIKRVGSLHLV